MDFGVGKVDGFLARGEFASATAVGDADRTVGTLVSLVGPAADPGLGKDLDDAVGGPSTARRCSLNTFMSPSNTMVSFAPPSELQANSTTSDGPQSNWDTDSGAFSHRPPTRISVS
ncbi:hypothetical protein GCM10010406_25090 [Streptomyces thermolineatus]|uniref:Uncharacterized protein n=1 Tax=Streptomyces thermolineatus TaxID=44033 RepID=A0ABN3LR89_9ACTN